MRKAIEEAKKFVCTTKDRIVKDAKEFIQNVDWKKVAIGVAGTLAVAAGVAATATGPGALVGVPAIVVSVEGVAVGATTATLGATTMLSSLQNLYDDLQNYNSSKNTWHKMTTKEADAAASELGFQKTNYRSHGQPVYKKGNKYITPDTDGHNGGIWKMADSVENLGSKSTRMGTYDKNLKRIGD